MSETVTGAEALIQALINEGVETIFGYPGGAIMPTYDALPKAKIRHILVRHEQGAAHAAEGYARATGKVGVCMATSGPGATNLVTGIADAMMDSVPMVAITGQVASPALGTDAFQETDVIGVTIPITKWNFQITQAEEIPEIISKAFYVARTGRPGPVLIDITKDAQVGSLEPKEFKPYQPDHKVYTERNYDLSQAQRAADLINESERPLLLVGHGVLIAGAKDEVVQLAETAGIPAACTLHGLSAFPPRHELYTGMLGMHGNYGPNVLTNQADLLIAVGMRFDDRVTGSLDNYAPDAKVIHIEIDAAEIDKIVKTDAALVADAKEALLALLPLVKENAHPEWLKRFEECSVLERKKVIDDDITPGEGRIKMAEAIHLLSEMTDGQAAIVADVGQHQMMSARYYRYEQPHSYITSGGLGTMGFALPAALGYKVGQPEREVIAIIGDGCFQMTFQELGTVAQEKLPLKAIVMNNNYLGMVRQWQELFFEKNYSQVHLQNPDFPKLCDAFGIKARRVEKREDLKEALQEMLDSKEAFVLELVVGQEDNVFPMIAAGASVDQMRLE